MVDHHPSKLGYAGSIPVVRSNFMPYSLEYKREYQRKWMAERKAAYFKNKCCCICGSKDRLELDHIDPSQKITNCIWSWSKQRQAVELAKCQVLCYHCHKLKTSMERSATIEHGTDAAYNDRKCRCDLCRQYQIDRCREWKQRTNYREIATLVEW